MWCLLVVMLVSWVIWNLDKFCVGSLACLLPCCRWVNLNYYDVGLLFCWVNWNYRDVGLLGCTLYLKFCVVGKRQCYAVGNFEVFAWWWLALKKLKMMAYFLVCCTHLRLTSYMICPSNISVRKGNRLIAY